MINLLNEIAKSDSMNGLLWGGTNSLRNSFIGKVQSNRIKKYINNTYKIRIGDSMFLHYKYRDTNGLGLVILNSIKNHEFYSIGFIFNKNQFKHIFIKNYSCSCLINSNSYCDRMCKKIITGWIGSYTNSDTLVGIKVLEYNPPISEDTIKGPFFLWAKPNSIRVIEISK